jgi:hypothetical protein
MLADELRMVTGNPEVMPRTDSQRRWPEVVLLAACDYAESHPETYNLDLMIPLKDIDKNRSDLEGIGFTTIAGHQGGRIRLRKRVAGVKMGAGRSFLCRPTSVSLILRRQPWMRW